MYIPRSDGKQLEVDLNYPGDTSGLLAVPALIDCHVHFRVPGGEHKEDWQTGARAALAGGVTSVCDMPNNTPVITTATTLRAKRDTIEQQLSTARLPLHYYLYIGATPDNADEIRAIKNEVVGIKIFMGSSTGNLLVDKYDDQKKVFTLAAELKLPIVAHAEDEVLITENKTHFPTPTITDHSSIRSPQVAASGVSRAIELAEETGATLYLLHISTPLELDLIRTAKKRGIKIFAETTPHHLFLTTNDYARLGTKAQMNPPLRSPADQEALWIGLLDGTIDTVATDHAPHTLAEKAVPYPASPSGVPGIETMLPLLLDSMHHGRISLAKIIELTSTNPRHIFNLPETNDWAIIDTNKTAIVDETKLHTKCGWSPFVGQTLTGWPVGVILQNTFYSTNV